MKVQNWREVKSSVCQCPTICTTILNEVYNSMRVHLMKVVCISLWGESRVHDMEEFYK